eukprot:TRINITY_DN3533_c0_g1_i1.p1 TRINITY_DN3533_c0_g1~~TRINITY_DN3533_c0_g1_i1.p1  ORF type:complete len:240 (-),score=73.33 TRINITY_DN3533_c0_g1_i1:134-853(-)
MLIEQNWKLLTQFMDLLGTFGNNVTTHSLYFIAKLMQLPSEEQKKLQQDGVTSRDEKDLKNIEKDIRNLLTFFTERTLFIKIHMIYKRYLPISLSNPNPPATGFVPGPGGASNLPSVASHIVGSGGVALSTSATQLPNSTGSANSFALSSSNSSPALLSVSPSNAAQSSASASLNNQSTSSTLYPGSLFLALVKFYEALGTAPICAKFVKDVIKNPEYKKGLASISLMIGKEFPNLYQK